MVIGIQDPGKRTAGGSRGVSAPSARPFRPIQQSLTATAERLPSKRRQRRQQRRRRQQQRPRRQQRRPRRQQRRRRVGGSGARIGSRVSGSQQQNPQRSGGVGGLILLGATGTQHEGNRNGAPDLCIHRQLPQYVSENYSALARREQLNLWLCRPVASTDFSGIAIASKGRRFATVCVGGYSFGWVSGVLAMAKKTLGELYGDHLKAVHGAGRSAL